jgi:EmrB/QacA subfamily drug resistance transporter
LSAEPRGEDAKRVRVVFGALLVVVLLAALDQTIVSTALPTIVGELGGIEHLSWVVTSYLLAATVVTPLYGKLGDLYGRKLLLQVAVVIFLIGSILCGLSQNMGELIAFRAVQGLGGGGLIVLAMATVGDLVPPSERGRYQGMFGAVFGVATVIGPLVGGYIVEHLSWRWIFYVNIPVGLAALAVIAIAFTAPTERRRHAIDYLGAGTLAGALSAIVLFTSLGGTTYDWGSPQLLVLAVLGVVLTGAFLLAERRAAEPILPLDLFRNRVFSVASAIGFVVGLALFGSVTFLPLYLQVVKEKSPSASGLLLLPLMAGVLVASIGSGQLITRMGRYRVFPIVGTALMTVAMVLLSRLWVDTPIVVADVYVLILGLGLGFVMQVLVLAVQNAVDYEHLGVATSGATLFRSIGGSIGVALFGAIFANRLGAELAGALPPGTRIPAAADPDAIRALPPAVHTPFVEAFASALQIVFLAAVPISILAFALTWFLREVPLRKTVEAEGLGETFASPRDDDSLRELGRAIGVLTQRENRGRVYERIAERAGVELGPRAAWLLARLDERAPIDEGALADDLDLDAERLDQPLEELQRRGLVSVDGTIDLTPAGRDVRRRFRGARREALCELLDGWDPDANPEVSAYVDELVRELQSQMPEEAPV